MSPWKFFLSSVLSATFAVQPTLAADPGSNVVEVVTFKLKAGVTAAEFAPIDKAVERDHVAKQQGFVSRESAHGADGALRLPARPLSPGWPTARTSRSCG